jgi:hypothetical protein
MNTTENNVLIAKFMQNITIDMNDNIKEDLGSFKYHIDWNWLMEVVEKIENLGCNEIMGRKLYSRFEINHNCIKLHWSKDNKYQLFIESKQDWKEDSSKGLSKEYIRISINENATKLEAIYSMCVEFIKWYNENKI